MTSIISQHPGLHHAQQINDLCRPLNKLNISYFAHIRVDKESRFSGLSNNPGFTKHYLENKYYNADIHMAEKNQFGKYVIWDAIERTGKSEQMYLEGIQFGVQHTFTIIDVNDAYSNFYHFATDTESRSINQTYLTNLDLLNLFINHFTDNVNKSKLLSNAYDLTFSLDPDAEGYSLKEADQLIVPDKDDFLRSLRSNPKRNILMPYLAADKNSKLTKREMECIQLYATGKLAKDIALTLGLSIRTVQHYLENAKCKMGVTSKHELLELVISKLLSHKNMGFIADSSSCILTDLSL